MGCSTSHEPNVIAKQVQSVQSHVEATEYNISNGGRSSSNEGTLPRIQGIGTKPVPSSVWTHEAAEKLQQAVDRVFAGACGASLVGLEFSFTIADPFLDGCPLIGCSSGFTKLCGYDMEYIVGRNCRFLIDPVPAGYIDQKMRKQTKKFCEAVGLGQKYQRLAEDYEPWMPQNRPLDELLAMQKNARKDGSLFNNLFYLKVFDLSLELGEERPYIVGLQSELHGGKESLAEMAQHLEDLDERMARVKRELGAHFFVQCSISRHKTRQFGVTPPEFFPEKGVAPKNLHEMFSTDEVQPWEENRFKTVRKLGDATSNYGVVLLRHDTKKDQLFAVKQMPNSWIRDNHDDFRVAHPSDMEMPWQDIGCTRYLNSVNYRYSCVLDEVYRNKDNTFVVSSFASGGDLFDLSQRGDTPGPTREAAIAKVVVALLSGLMQLHNMQIVHRDISLENVLLTKEDVSESDIRIIDFGMCSMMRTFRTASGKASYQAPEMQGSSAVDDFVGWIVCEEHDGFLADMFAAGVLIYALMVKDYPWLSTKPGRCKCFDFVQKFGFRAYCANRKVRGSNLKIDECLSEPLMQLLEGMLAMDPSKRLTLGEKIWAKERRSVWDEPWMSIITTKSL